MDMLRISGFVGFYRYKSPLSAPEVDILLFGQSRKQSHYTNNRIFRPAGKNFTTASVRVAPLLPSPHTEPSRRYDGKLHTGYIASHRWNIK